MPYMVTITPNKVFFVHLVVDNCIAIFAVPVIVSEMRVDQCSICYICHNLNHYLPKFIWKVDQKWNQVKLELARTLLKITHLAPKKASGYYFPQFIWQINQKWNQVKLVESVRTLLKITHSASRKSYLIIIWPQFTWKVDQNQNSVKLESVRIMFRITHLAFRKSYLFIICPISHEKLTKNEIR